jgi:hypothetical protein
MPMQWVPMMGGASYGRNPNMSNVSAVQGVATLTPVQRAKLIEGTPAEEKTESAAQEAKEQAADQVKRAASKPQAHAVDHFA